MLLLILNHLKKNHVVIVNSNTSYVAINLEKFLQEENNQYYSNTSYVAINREGCEYEYQFYRHSNTSYVAINLTR